MRSSAEEDPESPRIRAGTTMSRDVSGIPIACTIMHGPQVSGGYNAFHAQAAWVVFGVWHTRAGVDRAYMLQRNRFPRGTHPMTVLVLAAIVAVAAVNISLVTFVADRLTPAGNGPATAGELVLVNDNAPASLKLAA